jgi:3-hydroxyacyl-CoA dehydrogenase
MKTRRFRPSRQPRPPGQEGQDDGRAEGRGDGPVKPTTADADFAGVDLVIEAATENLGLKLKILKELEAVIGADTIIASNTSSISITQLAAATGAPASSSACTSSTRCR